MPVWIPFVFLKLLTEKCESLESSFLLNWKLLLISCCCQTFLCRYDTGLKNPNRRIALLDQLLSNQDFLVEGVFTVADVAVAAYFLYVLQFFPGIDLSRWPSVVKYLQACVSRTEYGQAFGKRVQASLERALADMTQD